MKKIICIPFFLAALLLIASCKGSLTPENPDDSHNSNNQQDEQEISAVVDKFFWGTWVRMDSGAVYEIDESKISVYKKDSDQLTNSYDAISSTSTVLSISEIGKFSKQSDSVIQNNSIPYFRKGGSNLSYSLKVVGFEDTISRAASSLTSGNVKVKASSKKYKSYKKEAQPTEEGVINLTAPVSGDVQTVTVSAGDTVLVVPEIKIENDGCDMGTIPVTNPNEYSLKVTGVIDDSQKDDGYLYGNSFKSYSMTLTITNISEVTSETSACEIKSNNPNLKITDENGAALNVITISTLKPGLTKEIKIEVSYGNIESGYVDTGINVDITNMKTGRTWKDYVPLRFFRGMLPITVTAKSTENNADAALNGFVIYPDYNSQFFDIPHGSSKTLYVPDFGKDKSYTLSFSGATVEGELSDSTEMFYVVEPGTIEQKDFTIPTNREDLIACYNFGEPNDTETASYDIKNKFMAYLNDGDIDFFKVNVEYDKFISPEKKVMYKVVFEDSYNPDNNYVKLFNSGENLGSSYSRKNNTLPKGYNSFLGWYLNDSKISENYTVRSNITLKAKYNLEKYTITFKLRNINSSYDIDTNSYTIEEEVPLYTPSRTGYTFEGWYEDSNYSGENVTVIPKGSIGNKSFYAKWSLNTYNISYELNGGSNSEFNKTTYTVEDSFSLYSPTKKGFIFEGWYENSDFSGSKIVSITSDCLEDKTLYAKWKGNVLAISVSQIINNEIIYPSCTIEEMTDFVLKGTHDGKSIVLGQFSSVNELTSSSVNVELGSWDFVLTAKKGNTLFSNNISSYTIKSGINNLAFSLSLVEDEIDAEDGKGIVNIKLNLPTQNDISLAKAGLFSLDTEQAVDGFNLTALQINNNSIIYEKQNVPAGFYKFKAIFYADENGTVVLKTYEENIVVAALCTSSGERNVQNLNKAYFITYNTNGGAFASTEIVPYVFTSYSDEIILQPVYRDGYSFDGWYLENSFKNQIDKIPAASTKDYTLYAKWCLRLNQTTLNFLANSNPNLYDAIYFEGEMNSNDLEIISDNMPENKVLDLSAATGMTSIGYKSYSDSVYSSYFTSCKNIVLPDVLKSIRDGTFYGCSSLTQITIPAGVTTIGFYAFQACSSLKQINIPSGVSKIQSGTFIACNSLTQISIPEGVKTIEDSAFEGCSSLTQITIPDSVTSIENKAFKDCRLLSSIKIPDGVKNICASTFQGCTSLSQITIPEDLVSIKGFAFYNCSALKQITIPAGVSKIETYTFFNCDSLTTIILPAGVKTIEESAFEDCSSLTQITIQPGVTAIGENAFESCTSLTQITIPNGVTKISKDCFNGCIALTQISIPESVESVESWAFNGCHSLTQIVLPEGVISVGAGAFSDCSSLAQITIPQSISNIESSAFRDCSKLKKINYNGTKSQWKSTWTSYFPSGATIYCTDGNISIY